MLLSAAPGLASFGAEIVLSPRDRQTSTVERGKAAMAVSGSTRLVVWEQRVWETVKDGNWDILIARLGPGGSVLDPMGIAVATGVSSQTAPRATAGADAFLIIWSDDSTLRGRRVGLDGTWLDPVELELGIGDVLALGPQGAGFRVLVRSGYALRDVAISPSGGVTEKIAFTTAGAQLRAASIGEISLALYLEGWALRGMRLSADGSPLDATGTMIHQSSTPLTAVSAIPVDGGHVVAWQHVDSGPAVSFETFGAIVSNSGLVTKHQLADMVGALATASIGSEAAIIWGPNFARLSATGTILQAAAFAPDLGSVDPHAPMLVGDPPGYSVLRNDAPAYRRVVTHLSTSLTADGPVVLPFGAASEQESVVASSNGSGHLVLFVDRSSSDSCIDDEENMLGELRAVALDACGAVLQSYPSLVSTIDRVSAEWPALAFGAGVHVAVWRERGPQEWSFRFARITPAGDVLDPGGVELTSFSPVLYPQVSNPSRPIASDGTAFLIAYADVVTPGTLRLVARRVDAQGNLDPVSTIVQPQGLDLRTINVAFDGTNYLLSWSEGYQPASLRVARVSPSGTLLDASAQTLAVDKYVDAGPIASDGTGSLVTWVTSPPAGTPLWRGQRVGTDGKPSGGIWDLGTGWPIGTLGFSNGAYVIQSFNPGVWGGNGYTLTPTLARRLPDGTSLDPVPLSLPTIVSAKPSHDMAVGANDVLVAYTPHVGYPDNAHRARARIVSWNGGTACAGDGGVALGADFGASLPAAPCPAGSGGSPNDAGVGAGGGGGIGASGGSTDGGGAAGIGNFPGVLWDAGADAPPSPEAADPVLPAGGCACALPTRPVPNRNELAVLLVALSLAAAREKRNVVRSASRRRGIRSSADRRQARFRCRSFAVGKPDWRRT